MEKGKTFKNAKFTPECIKEASELLNKLTDGKRSNPKLDIRRKGESLGFDSEEEFFGEYRSANVLEATYMLFCGTAYFSIHFCSNMSDSVCSSVSVSAKTRAQVESIFEIFEKHYPNAAVTTSGGKSEKQIESPTVFIGHGRSVQWKELKDHLHEKQQYDVEFYEIGERAGRAVRDILESMLDRSSIAFLVMTAEDKTDDGKFKARDNVIHELGLFQGRLGWGRAIVLLEEGCEEFSNISGIQQIRYSKGNIKETFGDVVATIKREFGLK